MRSVSGSARALPLRPRSPSTAVRDPSTEGPCRRGRPRSAPRRALVPVVLPSVGSTSILRSTAKGRARRVAIRPIAVGFRTEVTPSAPRRAISVRSSVAVSLPSPTEAERGEALVPELVPRLVRPSVLGLAGPVSRASAIEAGVPVPPFRPSFDPTSVSDRPASRDPSSVSIPVLRHDLRGAIVSERPDRYWRAPPVIRALAAGKPSSSTPTEPVPYRLRVGIAPPGALSRPDSESPPLVRCRIRWTVLARLSTPVIGGLSPIDPTGASPLPFEGPASSGDDGAEGEAVRRGSVVGCPGATSPDSRGLGPEPEPPPASLCVGRAVSRTPIDARTIGPPPTGVRKRGFEANRPLTSIPGNRWKGRLPTANSSLEVPGPGRSASPPGSAVAVGVVEPSGSTRSIRGIRSVLTLGKSVVAPSLRAFAPSSAVRFAATTRLGRSENGDPFSDSAEGLDFGLAVRIPHRARRDVSPPAALRSVSRESRRFEPVRSLVRAPGKLRSTIPIEAPASPPLPVGRSPATRIEEP